MKTIIERQTIRSYKNEQISSEQLEYLKEAALFAPSGRNSQPCHIRFVQSRELLNEFNTSFKDIVGWDTPAYTRWNKNPFYHNAPTFAFIFSQDGSAINAGIMAENICIAAKGLGLGTCIVASVGALFENGNGIKEREEINIPENFVFDIGIAIGYPDEKPEKKPRFDDRIEVIE